MLSVMDYQLQRRVLNFSQTVEGNRLKILFLINANSKRIVPKNGIVILLRSVLALFKISLASLVDIKALVMRKRN